MKTCLNTGQNIRTGTWFLVTAVRIDIGGLRSWLVLLGTLSKDEDDGSENFGKKMNLRSFKLNRVYLDPRNMSNAGDFSWSRIFKDFIQVQKEEETFVAVCSSMSMSSTKRQIRRFNVVVVQWTSRKCTKERDARAELLF